MHDLTDKTIGSALAGRTFEYFESIGSTNDRALALLQAGAASGTVVIAEQQTSGRGRLGRAWHSPAGAALMCTVVLRPPDRAFHQIGMAAALAVVEAIEAAGAPSVGIKWPNDVQIAGRKVCGVLPEAVWYGEQRAGAIVGIGINVRVNFAGSGLEETAISLESVTRTIDRADMLADLLTRLDGWMTQLGDEAVFQAWAARLTTIGRIVSVETPAGRISGQAARVDSDGALILATDDGEQRVIAGDIEMGRPA